MKNALFHTPEGVRDRYNEEIAKKSAVIEGMISVMHTYGYRDIETPTIEFFDVFNKDRGSVGTKDMFKTFDKEGNTIVLRPDITPSIARAVAKYFADEDMPIRLSYCGNTFYNSASHQGRMKEVTQLGAELVGDETSDADSEMIAMLISCLKKSGIKDFQVELGHAGLFKTLVDKAGLDEDETDILTVLYENKNFLGVENFLKEREKVSDSIRNNLVGLSQVFGNIEQVSAWKEKTDDSDVIAIIEYLEKVYSILAMYGLEKYVSFDLGIVGHYKYYTGIIVQGYTYGTGEVIATGGRYDKLMKQFGKDVSSVGYGINVDLLMLALARQGIEVATDIYAEIFLYEREQKQLAISMACQAREEGRHVQLMKKFHEKSLDDYRLLARRSFIDKIVYIDADGRIQDI